MAQYCPSIIWYASDKRALSCLKVLVFDDKGALAVRDGVIRFAGERGAKCLIIEKIDAVEMASQNSNWPVHLAAATALIGLFTARGYPVIVTATIVIMTAIIGISIGRATKWVRVAYRTEDGKSAAAWFADGSGFGRAALIGGSQMLYDVIRKQTIDSDQVASNTPESEDWIVLGLPQGYKT
jgi:hypothetical protein